MTQVEMVKDGNGIDIRVLGHAGYGNAGNDIVCAAASILSATLVQCLDEMDERGELRRYDKEIAPGCVKIRAEPEDGAGRRIDALTETIMTGYLLLENQYGKYVHVSGGEIQDGNVV